MSSNGTETENKFHWNSFLAYVVLVLIRYYLFGQYDLPSEVYPKAMIVHLLLLIRYYLFGQYDLPSEVYPKAMIVISSF
jgi:phage-related holin